MIGEAALGIYYTLENLTVSRLANAAGAMGLARKAHLESLYRAQARSAFGKPIVDHPLVRYDLTDLAVRTAAGSALLFHAVEMFDRAWHETPPYSDRYHYARFLSHLTKNRTAEHGAAATQLAMEIFGGLGFLDDFGIARLHREVAGDVDLGRHQQHSSAGYAGSDAQEERARRFPRRVAADAEARGHTGSRSSAAATAGDIDASGIAAMRMTRSGSAKTR